MNDIPYLALTGELWVSFVSYEKETVHDISRAHRIVMVLLVLITDNTAM